MSTLSSRAACLVATLCLMAGCAQLPSAPVQAPVDLLDDTAFGPPTQPVDTAATFALSDAMRDYAAQALVSHNNRLDPRRLLFDALYTRGGLRLDYDATLTRNAAQAFDARSGNCLSLAIMTAAFARHMGLQLTFQRVDAGEDYTRHGDLTLANGHVNIVLGPPPLRAVGYGYDESSELTIDFLPGSELRRLRSSRIDEQRVVALFANNRAAEALTGGRLDDAYAWARAALLQDPGYTMAANTLAVVYLRKGRTAAAERALQHVLAAEPDSIPALSNLLGLLKTAGRDAEAQAVAVRLARLQPEPPFHFFDLGRLALAAGDAARARDLFARELRRQPQQDQVLYWAALADLQLGDAPRAAGRLKKAADNSTTQAARGLYSAKLEKLRALGVQ